MAYRMRHDKRDSVYNNTSRLLKTNTFTNKCA